MKISINRISFRVITSCLVMAVMTGCSQNYQGERLFWKARRTSAPIFKDPSHAGPEQIAMAINAYTKITEKMRGTIWAARAYMTIGLIHMSQRQYDKAREVYTTVLMNYNQYKDVCLSARFAAAKSYEIEKNFDEAIKIYHEFPEYHAWTTMGLEAPLYVAKIYQQRGMTDQATKAYEVAVRHYNRLIPRAPSGQLAARAKYYLSVAYEELSRWKDAIQTLEEVADEQSEGNRPLALFTLGTIYQTKTQNLDKAQQAYTRLIEQFPQHPLAQAARSKLESLQQPEAMSRPAPKSASSGIPVPPGAVAPVSAR